MNTIGLRTSSWLGSAFAGLMLLATPVFAQAPEGPVEITVGSSAGGTPDVLMRSAAKILNEEKIVANPIVGAGIGQDILALDRLRARATWRSIHNAYLEYAVDLGLPGLLLFLWLLVATFRSARRVERRASTEPALRDLSLLASSVQIALAAFAVAAFFHPIAYQFYFFCVAGLAVALRNTCVAELSSVSAEPR